MAFIHNFNLKVLSAFFILMNCSFEINGANILCVVTTPSRSHLLMQNALFEGLAERGHNVTVLATLPPLQKDIPNYKYIHVQLEDDSKLNPLLSVLLNDTEKPRNMFLHLPKIMSAITSRGNVSLNHPTVKRIMRDGQYDLVIIGWFANDHEFGLAAHFNCPLVIVTSAPTVKHLQDCIGAPYSISTVRSKFLASDNRPMSFIERVKNVLLSIVEILLHKLLTIFLFGPIYAYNFPPDKYPPLAEIRKNVSLVIVNQHFSQDGPQANVPALIEAGGMHIKSKPDPLPQDIQDWLDSATDGAILFSLGSNIKSSELPMEKRHEIFRAFSKLKQKIIWKFEDDTLPNKPENVLIKKWLPQNDILAHPNTVLFISHCGRGGVTESLYYGVPILGIPIFGDQMTNLESIVKVGWAVPLPYKDLSEESLYNGIKEAIDNPKYRNTVKGLSNLIRDRPQTPLETAIFWTEYVIRHGGAKHMQSHAVHLNLLQSCSLDVLAFIVFSLWVFWKILKISVKWLYGVVTRKNKQKHE